MKPADILFPEARKARDSGLCPICKSEIADFTDALSYKEFLISGLCQSCQDRVFGEPKELKQEDVL